MQNIRHDIMKRLESLAWKRSSPYCLDCKHRTILAPANVNKCGMCHSQNVTRVLPGVGVGPIEWIIKQFLLESPFDADAMFDEHLDGTKETVTFGNTTWTLSSMLKEAFPTAYHGLRFQFKSTMLKRGLIMRVDSELYWTDDIDDWLDRQQEATPSRNKFH